MAVLPTRSFSAIVQSIATGMQGRATALLDFAIGSVFRSIAEGYAGVALWLQGMILKVLQVTRLATSQGIDVDTWTADYMPVIPGTSSPRLPAVAATGQVTFSRISVGPNAIVIPVGAQLQTSDSSQQFTVYADPTNGAFSPTLNAYTLAANVSSVNVSVRANTPGTGGNVSAGFITQLQSSVSGIDTVNNSAPFINGVNAESDAALTARFPLYIASLSKATDLALGYAIISLQQGMQYTIHGNFDPPGPPGTTDNGMVTIYIDDGSGAPSGTLVAAAAAAINVTRAAGIRTAVLGASTITATVSMTITSAVGFNHSTVIGNVNNALGAFINAVGLENTLHYTQLSAIAYGVAGVTNVSSVLLNSGTSDLVPAWGQTIKAGVLTIS